jgi:hypothetical protein
MSQDTAYRVTQTESVKVETPKPKRGRRFLNWIKDLGNRISAGAKRAGTAIKRGLIRAGEGIKTAAATAVGWVKSAASASGRAARYVGHKLYWSGAAVGRGIGRTARFLGHSALTLVRVIPRFLLRTTGWLVRTLSAIFLAAFSLVWIVLSIVTIVTILFTLISAWTADTYDEKVHTHAKAWSRGEYREGEVQGSRQESALNLVRRFGREAEEAAEPKHAGEPEPEEVVVTETRVTEITPDDESIHAKGEKKFSPFTDVDHHDLWYQRKKVLPVPEAVEMADVTMLLDRMQMLHLPPHAMGEWVPIAETERGMALSDNDFFTGVSYWKGRNIGHSLTRDFWPMELDKPWAEVKAEIETKAKAEFALIVKGLHDQFEARALHLNSLRSGFNHQLGWFLDYIKHEWDLEKAGRDEAAAEKTAKKAATPAREHARA